METVRPDFYKALELHNAGRYEEALVIYNKILAECEGHITARNNRACLFDDLGMYDAAVKDLDTVIALCPGYGEAYYNRAHVNIKRKQYISALDDYRAAFGIKYPAYNPRELIVLVEGDQLNKGIAIAQKIYKSGFYARMPGDIKEKIILAPRNCEYRMVLQLNKLHRGKTIRRHLRQRGNRYELRYDSDFNAVFDRCRHYYHDPDDIQYFDALHYFLNGLNQCDDSPRAVGVSLYKDGKLAAGDIGVQVGRVYLSCTGFKDESSAGTALLILLGQHLIQNGYAFWDFGPSTERWDAYKIRLGAEKMPEADYLSLFRKVNPTFTTGLRVKPDPYETLCNLGNDHFMNGDFGDAIEAYTAALEMEPNDPDLLFSRGLAYTGVNDDSAIEDFTTLLEVKPSYAPIAFFHRGIAHANKGDHRKAIRDYKRSLDTNDEDVAALFLFGESFYKSGNYKRALAAWDRVLELNPEYPEINEKIDSARKEREKEAEVLGQILLWGEEK